MKNGFVASLILLLAVAMIAVTGCASNNGRRSDGELAAGESETVISDEGYLLSSPSNMLVRFARDAEYRNGFIYFMTQGEGLKELDIETGEIATIKGFSPNSHSGFRVYDGYIYAIQAQAAMDGSLTYSIVRNDFNSGDLETVYTPDNPSVPISFMSFSAVGEIFFVEGESIVRLNMGTGAKTVLTQGTTYYITEDRIFFTRMEADGDERLFTVDHPNLENEKDLGIYVCLGDDGIVPFMYYPVGNKLYYSTCGNELYCYDQNDGSTQTVCTFPDDTYVRTFQYFGSRMTVLLREKRPGAGGYQFGLYYLDEGGEPVKVIDDAKLNEGHKYYFENIEYVCKFQGLDDKLVMSTYNGNVERKLYLIDEDFSLEPVLIDGEWDYESFEQERDMWS